MIHSEENITKKALRCISFLCFHNSRWLFLKVFYTQLVWNMVFYLSGFWAKYRMTQLLTFGKPLLHTTELNSTENWIALGEIPNDLPLICLMDSWASYGFLQSCQSLRVLGNILRTVSESQIAVTGLHGLNYWGRNSSIAWKQMILLPREDNIVVSAASTFLQSKLLLLKWHPKRYYLFGSLFISGFQDWCWNSNWDHHIR